MKTCPVCKEKFTPKFSTLQKACSPKCAIEIASKEVKKENKKVWQREKKAIKEKLLTTSDWLQLLQTVFNGFVRERDFGLPCISCKTTANVQMCAGHYYTVGSYPNLRFDEDNVHGQCNQYCNMKLSGNLIEYRIGLIEKIGQRRFDELESRKQQDLKLTLPEIKEMISKYRTLTKELKQNRFYRS